MIAFSSSGSTKRTSAFLKRIKSRNFYAELDSLAQKGVNALRESTPVDSGLTRDSWSYEVKIEGDVTTISWINTNRNGPANIAILLQYGHATGTGGYVSGKDYINPAIEPIFDEIADAVWEKVVSS